MTPTPTAQANVLYFVDGSLPDLASLLAGLPAGAQVHLIEPGADGLQLLADTLAGRSGIDAIHLLTHGAAGSVNLGSTTLTSANLDSYSAQWATIQGALSADADFLIYGCNVAANDAGKTLIGQIADLSGADVAASTDLTGASALGGNWAFEFSVGRVQTPALEVVDYAATLADGQLPSSLANSPYNWNGHTFQTRINGALTTSDPLNPARADCRWDRYTLSDIPNGATVKVYMGNSMFDDYLQIERNGSIIAQNDDAGDGERGYDAYVSWTYQAGDVIRATTYRAGETGAYSLWIGTSQTISGTPTPPPPVDIGDTPPPPATAPTFTDSFGALGTVADTAANDTSLPNITGTLTATDTTPTGTLAFSGGGRQTYGTLSVSANGAFTFNPDEAAINTLAAGQTASHTFSVTVSDGALSTSKNLTVNFTGANDLPTVNGNATMPGILEDAGSTSATNAGATVASLFAGRFADVDAGSSFKGVLVTAVGDTTGQGTWNVSTDSGATWTALVANTTLLAAHKLQFVPNANWNGTPAGLTVKVIDNNDGQSVDTATVSITVTAVNDAPTFTVTTPITDAVTDTAAYDTDWTGATTSGTLAATDVESDAVLFSIRGGTLDSGTNVWTAHGLYGTLTVHQTTGVYTYTPTNTVGINALPAGKTALDSFAFKASDAGGAYTSRELTISITGANDTPVVKAGADPIADQSFSGPGSWQFQIPADSFTDAEGAGLAYTVQVVDSGGTAVDVGAGAGVLPTWLTFNESTRTFAGDPPPAWDNAGLNLKVTATDPAGASATDTFALTLTNTGNQPPVVASPIGRHVVTGTAATSEVTFTNALGGQTLTFNNRTAGATGDDTTVTLGSAVTGDAVAAAVVAAGDTTYYTVALKAGSANTVVFTAKALGDVIDTEYSNVVNGGTFGGANGGTATVTKVADGAATGTPESFTVTFAANGAAETTLIFNGVPVAITALATATDVANLVAAKTGTYTHWTAAQSGAAVTFTQKTPGNIPDITLADFTGTFDTAGITLGAITNGTGQEVFEVTYGGGLGGTTLIFDGKTATAGAPVTADTAASAFVAANNANGNSSFTAALKAGDTNTVVLTSKAGTTPGAVVAGDFSGTYTGVGVGAQSAGGAWTYTVPNGVFTDPDTDTLTYTAYAIATGGAETQLTTTGALQFDAATRTFSGDGSVSNALIELRATDAAGSNTTVATRFQLYLDDGVDSNVSAGVTIPTQTWTGAGSKTFQIPADAFNFNDGAPDTLEYTAQLAGGGSLPAWLTLNASTGVFSGNPPADAPASLSIAITATEKEGGSAQSSVSQTFTLNIASPNDAPTVLAPMADVQVSEAGVVGINVGPVFADADGATSAITYSVTQADGSPVPDWLTWNWSGTALTLNGNPPGNLPYLNIKVTGTDAGGATADSSFTLYLQDPGATSSTGAQTANNPGVVTITGATSGAIDEGQTLTAITPTDPDGAPLAAAVTYQWQVQVAGQWSDIAGTRGQGPTLTLSNDEAGKSVRVQAFYTDGGGVAEAPVSGAVTVNNVEVLGRATIAGGSGIGQVQTVTLVDDDGLVNVTPTYQWYRSDLNADSGYTAITGATQSTYVTTSADGERYLKVVLEYTDNQGTPYTIAGGTVAGRTTAVIQRGQVPPVANDDTAAATEAGGLNNATAGVNPSGNLLTNDTDLNTGDTKAVLEVRLGAALGSGATATESGDTFTLNGLYGTLTVNKVSGAYTYTVNQTNGQVEALAPGSTLTEAFNYTVVDSTSLTSSAKLTVTINGANDVPQVNFAPESSTVEEDLAGFVSTGLILSDPDQGAGANFALKLAVTAGRLVAVTPPTGITLKGDDTGTLTLTGNMNDINNWLQGDVIKYVAPPNVLGNVATLTFSANDGSGFVPVSTQTLSATNRNDAPIIDLNGADSPGNNFTTVFRPRGEAVAIVDGDISITDADAGDTLVSGTVSISSGALDNEFGTIFEKLVSSAGSSYAGSKGPITITGSGTASITLTGAGTHADYTALLKTITYSNGNPNAYSGDRTISISVTDAAGVNASASNLASFTTATPNTGIAVGQKIYLGTVDTGQTVASVLDASHFVASGPLSGLTSSSALSFKTTAAVNAAVTSASSFAVETVNPSIKTGLAIFKNGTDTGLTVSGVSGATITASGAITLATTDVLSFQTTASNNTPVQATTTVRVPWTSVVDMDGTTSAGRDYATTFTEDGPELAIATSTASIDNQAINIKTFTVTLTNPLDGTNGDSEALSISASMVQTLQNKGITVTVAANKHSITFQANNTTTGGTATDMQLGLRAIKYKNTDQDPSIVPRVISTYVLDVAGEVGVPATTTINIVPVNDAPVKGGDSAAGVNEGAVYVFTNADLNSTDVDNEAGTLKYILTSTPAQGTLFRDTNNNGVVDDGEAIATLGDSTSVTAINAIGTGGYFTQAEVNAGTIKYAHNGLNPAGVTTAGGTVDVTFGFKVVDGMEDYPVAGVIPAAQDGTVTLTITEVNDVPTGAPVVSGTMKPGQVLIANVSSIADADGLATTPFTYQWKVYDGSSWSNATGTGNTTASYTLATADSGKQVKVEVSVQDALGRSEVLSGNATGTVSFDNSGSSGSVTITDDGSPQAGETLTADTSSVDDPDGLGPFSYQWETSADNGTTWTTVAGATGKTYTLPSDAATGAQFRAVVSYTDGRGNPENIDSTPVTVQALTALPNQAPSLTGNGGLAIAAAPLFSNVAVSTVESGQTIQTLTLQVSGLQNGADEKLTVNGVAVDLGATTATTPMTSGTVSGVSYAVSVAGAVATVTVTHAGLTEAQTKTLVEGLALNGGTTAGLRVVTLKSLQDSGGGSTDTGLVGLSAMVDVGDSINGSPSSNTAPTVTASTATVAEGALVTLTTADLAGTDTEQTDGLKVVLTSPPTNGKLFRDANGNGKEDTGEALVSGSQFALADVQAGRIKYLHDGSETTSAEFKFTVSDGLASSAESTFSFTVTPVDDAPTLTATAVGTSAAPVVFTQGTSTAIDLFSSPAASPVETGEKITGVTLSISGLRDGAGEKLVVDGVEIALTSSTTGTTTTSSVSYAVTVAGGTATVTLTKDAADTVWNGLLDGLAYKNASTNPTNGTRAITLTSVTETGGEKSDVAITSYVSVTAVNGAPTLTLSGFTVLEGASKTLTTSDIHAADPDTPLTSLVYTLTSAPTHGSVYIDSNGDGKAQLSEILANNATFTHAQLASGKVRYQHDDGEENDSFGVSVSDGALSSAAATLAVTRTPVNDAPTIAGLGSDVLAYAANSGAKTLDQGGNAVVTDPDSTHFSGGNLRVSITFNRDAAHDVLSIKSDGTTAGLIGVSGTSVTYGGTAIGTFTGGTGTADLVVSFNTAATPEAVSALIKAIQFANDQAAPSHTSRTVSFALNDGQPGGQATPVAVNVNIAGGATPTISIGNGFFIMENTQLVTALSATDPASRPLTFSISGTANGSLNPDAGLFEIVSGNLLRFKGAPDFENPTDAGRDNVYNVIVRATNDQGSYAEQSLAVTVLDQEPEDGVAVGDTAGPVFGFATVNGNTLVMTYTDASHLSATNLPALSAFAVSGNTVTAVAVNATAKTVTLTLGTAVTAGQAVTVSYTDPTTGDDVAALQDAAGNDAASLVNASVSNITASTGGGGTGGGGTGGGGTGTGGGGTGTGGGGTGTGTGTGGTPGEGPIKGGTTTTTTGPGGTTTTTTTGTLGTVTVTETITVTVNGQSTHELVYVPVPSGAGGTGSVVFPLLYEPVAGSDSKTTVSLPTGVGLVSVGDRTPTGTGKGLNLIELIQQTVPGTDPTLENMLSGGQSFLDGRSSSSTLWVNKVVLTAPTPLTQAPKAPVIINGAANNASSSYTGDKLEALVIDARALPKGTVLELQNVDFAVVLGDGISVRGGNGVNVVFGGDGSQNIFLGADNDILYGGAGDDTVGSAEGADQIFGNSGNDTIFGGLGSDILHGGRDKDVALYSGSMSRYEITRDHGKTIVRSLDRLDDIDTVINVETLRFDDGTYTVQNELFHTQIATLYQQVFGRQADLGGFQYWAGKHVQGESMGTIALKFLYSAEYAKANSVSFDTLSQGAKVDLLYQHFLGRESEQAGHDFWVEQLNAGMAIEEVAAAFVGSKEMQASYLGPLGWEFIL